MKKTLILLTLCVVSQQLFAQGKPFEFGKIQLEDLKMEVYPADSGASAVYLVNKGEVTFNENDYYMYMKHHVRIKVLDEDGFDRADIKLRYLKGNNIKKLKAATYNLENGRKATTEVSRKQWVDEKFNGDVWEKKLSFPDVKVGSIIEYQYERKLGPFTDLPGWSFQLSIPVRYSEYKTDIPRFGSYQPGFKGYIQPTYYRPSQKQYHVVMENVPALKKEPYVATMENFRSQIDFEIKSYNIPGVGSEVFLEDWGAISSSLKELDGFGKSLGRMGQLKKIYPSDKGWGNNEESLSQIYNYVRDHFKWNEKYAYTLDESPKALWEKAEGDNADINFLLTMFLRKAGIEANPVVISTRGNGYLNQSLPLISQFNYMVTCARIDGKDFLLDATEKFRPYNILPERALNGEGLLIAESEWRWVNLRANKEIEARVFTANISYDEDEEMLGGHVSIVARSSAAANFRSSIFEEKNKGDEEETEEADEESESLDDYKVGEVSNIEIRHVDDPEKSIEAVYDFTSESNFDLIGGKIFMNPVLVKFVKENPFKLEERIYPVEFPSPISNTYIFNIDIPEGYEVEELPARQNLVLPEKGGRYTYIAAVQEDKVQIMIRLSLMKTIYLPGEYGALKELFNLIVAKQEEQIVFKEKGE